MCELFYKKLKDLCPIFVGIVGFIFTFFPFNNVDDITNIWNRLLLVVLLCAIFVAIVLAITIFTRFFCSNQLYRKEKTSIVFLYKSLKEIIADAPKNGSTIVVPINSFLPSAGDASMIRESSIHYQILEYLKNKGIIIDRKYIDSLSAKKIKMIDNDNCMIGDWFLVSTSDSHDKKSGLKFLFLVVGSLDMINGVPKVIPPTEFEYLGALQSLCEAIPLEADIEEKIYIPLIGAGNADVRKTSDIMRIIYELLIFNKSLLRQHIYVFVNPKYKRETNIFELN